MRKSGEGNFDQGAKNPLYDGRLLLAYMNSLGNGNGITRIRRDRKVSSKYTMVAQRD